MERADPDTTARNYVTRVSFLDARARPRAPGAALRRKTDTAVGCAPGAAYVGRSPSAMKRSISRAHAGCMVTVM
jgi:hypothetical protein